MEGRQLGNKKLGYLCLLNTVVLFSTYEVVSKTLVGIMDPFQVNFIRFFTGGLVLFIFLLLKGDMRISLRDFLYTAAVGVVNVVLSMSLIQLSLYAQGSRASVTAVIFSSNPIFVMLFSAVIDKERITLQKLIGLLAGMLGILIVFGDKLSFSLEGILSPVLALLSAVFYGLYTVLGRKVSVRIGSLKMNSFSFLAGSMVLLPFLLVNGSPVLNFSFSALPQVAYLSVFVTGIAYFTYFKGLEAIGASSGSLTFFIKPVLASVIAVIFLGEQTNLNLVLGTLLIISGIFTVIYMDTLKAKNRSIFAGFSRKV
jgi:drug/metabolite transporter (DMT)-like permease